MGFPRVHIPKASRKMQRTLNNLRVSFLCFLLTFLVLRNTIGAGKFGTPAQDFEEIRQHLHYVRLHRRHHRVLAEAVEEEKKQIEAPMLTEEGRSVPWPEESRRRINAPLRMPKEEQRIALIARQSLNTPLLTPGVLQGSTPLLTSRALQGDLLTENVGLKQKDLEGSRIAHNAKQQKAADEALAHSRSYGASRVLLLAGLQSSGCKNPAGEHLLLKSLKNKGYYTTLHGLEISVSFNGGVDPEPLSKLSLLQRTMVKHSHVSWLWWMPGEALITDMAFELPLENYTEFNLVLLGSDEKAHHQESLINLNTDTFLIRNCQWSLDLLRACVRADMDRASRLSTSYKIKGPRLRASDQCALLSNPKDDSASKIYTQHSAVLSGKWRDATEKVERIVKQTGEGRIGGEKLPFVTDFRGCNACQKGGGDACAQRIEEVVSLAEKHSMHSYASQRRTRVAIS